MSVVHECWTKVQIDPWGYVQTAACLQIFIIDVFEI